MEHFYVDQIFLNNGKKDAYEMNMWVFWWGGMFRSSVRPSLRFGGEETQEEGISDAQGELMSDCDVIVGNVGTYMAYVFILICIEV